MSKDQLSTIISKADKARVERTNEVTSCIAKARKDEVRDRIGFATEIAEQHGFAFIDDDADYMVCSTESLTDLMSVLGFRTREERMTMIELPQGYRDRPWDYGGALYTEGQVRAAIEADRKRRGEPVASANPVLHAQILTLRKYQAWRTGEDTRTMDEAGIVPAAVTSALDALLDFAEGKCSEQSEQCSEQCSEQSYTAADMASAAADGFRKGQEAGREGT